MRPEALDNQRLMESILADPSSWTPELAELTACAFDVLATRWVAERGGYRPAPLIDALERCAPPSGGRVLEIGSGTGVLTPYLRAIWSEVVCVDLSMGMMRLNDHECQVQADASALPFRDGAFDVIVIGDAPLFAHETARVLQDAGTLVWSNALGTGAPYFLDTGALLGALAAAAPDAHWRATRSEALWGSWAVLRRS